MPRNRASTLSVALLQKNVCNWLVPKLPREWGEMMSQRIQIIRSSIQNLSIVLWMTRRLLLSLISLIREPTKISQMQVAGSASARSVPLLWKAVGTLFIGSAPQNLLLTRFSIRYCGTVADGMRHGRGVMLCGSGSSYR